ncbi:hypothetical protein K4K59_000847 [Colletotrichum sp. SAR11_240]|nr:hypothetical protein K4K59_000847 [Colletotrichum sp. SAR11_240]
MASSIPSETTSAGISVITSFIDGEATTITLVGGSTLSGSPNATASTTPTPSESSSAEVSIITSVVGGEVTTITVVGGSTLIPANATSSFTASDTQPGGFSVVTTVIGGSATILTLIGGSTLTPSSAPTTATATSSPSQTLSAGVSVTTSFIDGVATTITVSDGSTLTMSTSNSTAPSPTATGGIIVITSIIEGSATTLTISDGSTIVASTTSSSAPISSPTGDVIVVTSTINGELTTFTMSDGLTLGTLISSSTATATLSATGEVIVITSIIEGLPTTFTVSDDVITVISSVIGGGASTWIISNGVTLPLPSNTTSPTSTPTGQIIVLTSIINGAASTWTVSDGSTLSPSAITTTASTPTGDAVTLTSTLPDGRVSIWTLIGTATITGSQNATATSSSSSSSATASSTSSAFDSAFTGISIVASQNASTCYTLPSPTESLHESKLDTQGKTAPYIDAFYLDNTTNSVKYIRLMNESTSDPILIDVSDPAKLAIIDKDGDTLSVDSQGLHFASAGCSPKIDVFISGFFNQINSLTNSTCTSAAALFDTPSGRPLQKRQTSAFDVLLRLKDQCERGQSLLDVIGSFLGIYDYSTSTFGNSTSQAGSGMGDLIEGYGLTTIQTQVCQYLQTSSQPLNLAFTAGTTTTPSTLAEITAIPSPTPEYDRNITDPTVMACCPNPGNCIFSEGSKFYPPESSIAGSNCFCGSMLGGGGIAFRTGSCLEENQCSQEKPCGEGKVCLTGNCCGDGTNPVNVCVDATECNAPRVEKRWADLFEGTAMGMV